MQPLLHKLSSLALILGAVSATSSLAAVTLPSDGAQSPAVAAAEMRLRTLPLAFEPNLGQAGADTRFVADAPGYRLELKGASSALQFASSDGRHRVRLTMSLAGSNPNAQPLGVDPLPGKINYLVGPDPSRWHTGVSSFAKVVYRSVYRGVDLVYYGNQGRLEYDLVVAPHADPQQIRMQFPGARGVRVDAASGDLVITTEEGIEVRHGRPSVYQGAGAAKTRATGGYALLDAQTVAFSVSGYDPARALTIDPTIGFVSYIEGLGDDLVTAVAGDSSGNSYVTGVTSSTRGFPSGGNINASDYIPQKAGNYAALVLFSNNYAYLLKFSTQGGLVYKTYYGGEGADWPHAMAIDASGVYVAGETTSLSMGLQYITEASTGSNGLTNIANSAYAQGLQILGTGRRYLSLGVNAFIVQFDPLSGVAIQGVLFGGGTATRAQAIALDSAHAAYVTGMTCGAGLPTSSLVGGHPFQAAPPATEPSTGCSAFVTKIDNAMTLSGGYSTYLSGSYGDKGNAIAVDSTGSAWVAGETCSHDFPQASAWIFGDPGPAGQGCTGFLTRLSSDGGSVLFSIFLGGQFDGANAYPVSAIQGIALYGSGAAYVVGTAFDNLVHPYSNAAQTKPVCACPTGYVAEVDGSGNVPALTLLSGNGYTSGISIAVNHQSQVYVGGQTTSAVGFPAAPTANAYPDGIGYLTHLTPGLTSAAWTSLLGNRVDALALYQPVSRVILPGGQAPATTLWAVGPRGAFNSGNTQITNDAGMDGYIEKLTDTPVSVVKPVLALEAAP